jgi:surface protein
VVDMERMFDDCPSFSSDLSSWDVSSVKNAKFMLRNAKQFNSDLSKWNFAPDTMDGMFSGAELFSSDLHNFDVSKVGYVFHSLCPISHYIPNLTFPRLAPHTHRSRILRIFLPVRLRSMATFPIGRWSEWKD